MKMRNANIMLLAALSSLPAMAEDGKGYPGAACQSRTSTALNTDFGRALNETTSSITMYCPLVQDGIGGDFRDDTGVVWLLDQTLTGRVSCTQNTRVMTTNVVGGWSVTGQYMPPEPFASPIPVKMTFNGVLGAGDIRTQAIWSYFSCTVPVRTTPTVQSGVVAYYASEGN